ncbi:MAG: polyhydroxyalkanoic acid system family protein [Croceibacterium sp.]
MQVAIPHQLGREETRRRLRANMHKMPGSFPAGMAKVTTTWPSEDQIAMAIEAVGQHLTGRIDIEDSQVLLTVDLPPALSFMEPILVGAIKQGGQKMLEPPAA